MKIGYKYLLLALVLVGGACSDDGVTADRPTDQGTDGGPSGDEPFQGVLVWTKTFGGTKEDNGLSLVATEDGGYAVAGYTLSTDGDIQDKKATDGDYWLLRLDEDGNLLWSRTYGGTNDDRAEKLIQTKDGGYVMVGYSRSNDEDATTNEGLQDYWIVKVDTQGELEWEKNFGFAGIDRAYSVVETLEGGFFISGFMDVTASDGKGNEDGSRQGTRLSATEHGVGEYWGIKLDDSGKMLWRRYFGGSNNDRSYDVLQTKEGDFLMVGSSESIDFDVTDSKGSYDFWVLKVSADGDLIWQKSFGGSEADIAYAITETVDNNYIIVGDARSADGSVTDAKGNADLWAIKINGDGNLLWEKSFGGTKFDTGRDIFRLRDGNFFITGNSRSNDMDVDTNKGQSDLLGVIIDAKGKIQWQATFGGSNAEFGFGGVETEQGEIVVVGSSESSDFDISENKGSKDLLIAKYK